MLLANVFLFVVLGIVYMKYGYYVAGGLLILSSTSNMGVVYSRRKGLYVLLDVVLDLAVLLSVPSPIIALALFIIDVTPDLYMLYGDGDGR